MELSEIIDRLKPLEPQQIILFGSRAKGDAGAQSDFDIAVIKETNQPFHERLIEARRLLRTTTPIDLFVFTKKEMEASKEENPFIHEIVSTGKVVYGK